MRRLTAFLGILLILGLVLTLLWRVYLHHEAADPDRVEHSVVARANFAMTSL